MSSSLFRRAGAFIAPTVCALVAGLTLFVGVVPAQASTRPLTATSPEATRAQLTRLLDSLVVDSARGTPARRRERTAEISTIRQRLTQGDFQVGDRFLIDNGVQRDTVLVRDSVTVAILPWPSYPLRGVLRSELQGAIETYVGNYVRQPRIRVSPLTRIGFTGGFGRTGYVNVDPTRPFSDALAMAGGVAPGAKSEKITVYRGDKRLLSEDRVAEALRNGETIDDLRLLPGDEARVPAPKNNGGWASGRVQVLFFGISALATVLALIRSAYNP